MRERHYMQLQVLSHVYNETFGVMFKFLLYNMVVAIIAFTYLLIRSAIVMPFILVVAMVLADMCAIILAYYIFSLVTDVHILSKALLKIMLSQCKDRCSVEAKFWKGIKPLSIGAGRMCAFETKEFLLVIWGDIIIATLIDLLIAF